MREAGSRTLITALAAALLLVPAGAAAQSDDGGVIERALESRARGGDSATVVVFEVADFQCPYCGQFARDVGPQVQAKYVDTGRVQWVFVNLPLQAHRLAFPAAEAALCAGATGDQFWGMHDRLFAEQETWTAAADPQALFAQYAADLGVPAEAYQRCTRNDEVAPVIIQDLGSAVSAGITGTPTFIIMKGQQVVDQMVGVHSMEEWSQKLDAVLP